MEELPADLITETNALSAAPVWRSEPYISLWLSRQPLCPGLQFILKVRVRHGF
jgi:hypothetical protein